jgi:hypothetical protein
VVARQGPEIADITEAKHHRRWELTLGSRSQGFKVPAVGCAKIPLRKSVPFAAKRERIRKAVAEGN